jgi:hypothetical protein
MTNSDIVQKLYVFSYKGIASIDELFEKRQLAGEDVTAERQRQQSRYIELIVFMDAKGLSTKEPTESEMTELRALFKSHFLGNF